MDNDNHGPGSDAAHHERWLAWCRSAKHYDELELLLDEVGLRTGWEIWTGYGPAPQGDWFSINGQEFLSIEAAHAYCRRILDVMATRH